MSDIGWLLVAVLAAYCCALATPLLWLRGVQAAFATAFSVALLICCPLLAPADNMFCRALASLFAGDQIFKVIDVCRLRMQGGGPTSYRDYAAFLLPIPFLSVVYEERHWRSPWQGRTWRECLGLLLYGLFLSVVFVATLAGILLTLERASHLAIFRQSFVLDHLKLVIAFCILVEALPAILFRLERLVGYDVVPFVRRTYLSRTVGEYWQRYNQRIQDWLAQNVFFPSGGKQHPVRGVFLVFLFSAIFHEVLFGVATKRFDGYQFLFFMLQIPGVLMSERLKPILRRAGKFGIGVARVGTFVWFAVTSVFFFHGVYKLLPYVYAGPHPLP